MIPFTGTSQSWNDLIASLPLPHLLQTWEWSQVKARYGWQPMPFVWVDGSSPAAAAMILKRSIPVGGFARRLCVLYIPKGPNLDWDNAPLRQRVLADLERFSRQQAAIFIKLDPDVSLGLGIPGTPEAIESAGGETVRSELARRGWKFSQDQIQFRNTVLIDLSPDTDDLLARMKQKTRYNLRLAQKKGVTVRIGTMDDLPLLYRMYAETSVRDGFLIREEGYYQTVWNTFTHASLAAPSGAIPFHEPLIAEVAGEPVGAVSMFYFAGQAIYLFGMSRAEHREKMPNYLLQWEAMQRAKALNCKTYNLWGAPDKFEESDGLWGVFRFKEGLGGYVSRTLGAWDFTPNPLYYKIYTEVLPRLMDIMRARGKARTRQNLGA
ncbi:MAG TPA: peptidoglycan bridge formation glycyltransferase FemA/FemB family protein [Anaerolineales bacterium]|nr:peptidoglycan bridge formation glycyltransferase FemA/FemB family protein [Anaerolineales bacterium]